MIIRAIFYKKDKEILYSRNVHDCKMSTDGKVGIDGGIFDYCRILGNPEDYIILDLDGGILLEQILNYDWKYRNKNADKYPLGYCGKFIVTKQSNVDFYKKLILNFNEVKEYFNVE